jgi:hypothetical protein
MLELIVHIQAHQLTDDQHGNANSVHLATEII